MGRNKIGRGTISAVVNDDLIQLIDLRRQRLTISRSAYLTLIIEQWKSMGCPPVNPAEHAIAELEKIKHPSKKK